MPPPLARRHPNFGSWGWTSYFPGRVTPRQVFGPNGGRAARWVRSVSDDPKKSSERNYLVRRYSSVTTFSARDLPALPIIFATFDHVSRSVPIPQSLADELVSYTQWALQFSSHSRDEIRDTLLATAVERLLNRDYIWQLSKKPNLLPQQRAHPTVHPHPAARKRGRRPRSEQPAPLIFLPPDTLTPQEIYLPEALATQGDAYVRWLAAEHHLPEQVVLILAFERATRSFSGPIAYGSPTDNRSRDACSTSRRYAQLRCRCPRLARQALGYLADNHDRERDAGCSEAEFNYIARLDPGWKTDLEGGRGPLVGYGTLKGVTEDQLVSASRTPASPTTIPVDQPATRA